MRKMDWCGHAATVKRDSDVKRIGSVREYLKMILYLDLEHVDMSLQQIIRFVLRPPDLATGYPFSMNG